MPVLARSYTIGIVGGGVVGGGIARIIEEKRAALESASGAKLDLKTVCVRSLGKERDWEAPPGCVLTDKVSDVVGNKDIDLVVEVAGGVTDAKDVVFGAIEAGQDVVTANKALIAAYLPELEQALTKSKTQFGFEAAVLGGIPIIHALQNDFVGDVVTKMSGIMNGCTNFMLTKMAATGCSYMDILAEAQELGYAEADPTLDVGGQDARSKLKILIKLAFGLEVNEPDIPCYGITEISPVDFAYAKLMGGTIKLLGSAELKDGGAKLSAFVAPAFVPSSETLASIGGATNAINVESENLGSTLLVGQGAGRFPTANSAINDVAKCAGGTCRSAGGLGRPGADASNMKFDEDFEAGFYLRCDYKDGIGIVKELGETCAKHGVSIYSMQQLPAVSSFVVITDKTKASAIQKVAADIKELSWAKNAPFWMPAVKAN